MSALKRSILTAMIMAIGALMVPVSITPAGGVELDNLCASMACKKKAGAWCWAGGDVIWDYKSVIG